jgi:DNA-binding response OmpR family regulator
MAAKRTVLVVEDDRLTRQMMRGLLEKQGLDVVEAADGREAVERFRQSPADLILLDASMPRLDGFSACKQIRRLESGTNVPILMVTSLSDSDSVKRASAAGATDFVTKPISWASLGQLVKQHIRKSEAAALCSD